MIAREIDGRWLTSDQMAALQSLAGREFEHAWQFHRALADQSAEWRLRPAATVNKIWNKELEKKLEFLERIFQVDGE